MFKSRHYAVKNQAKVNDYVHAVETLKCCKFNLQN